MLVANPSFGGTRSFSRLALFSWGLLAALPSCGAVASEPDPTAQESAPETAGQAREEAPEIVRADLAGLSCPPLMALVPVPSTTRSVCIDRYEAGVERKKPDGSFEPWPFDRVVDGLTVRAVVAAGRKPQAYISGTQAQAACKLAGKRLCSSDEWLAACQGPSRFTYPYGNTYQKGACNEGRATNPVNDCFGPGGGVFTSKNMNDPCCVNKPNTVAAGGAYSKCVSAYGVYDLHGNLHEWVDTTTAGGNGVFRGGFFVDAKINGAGCLYRTVAHAKSYHDYSNGFRCCADPKSSP